MSYAFYNDLKNRYGKFAEDIHGGSAPLVNSVTLFEAESIINGRLAIAFPIPLTGKPPKLTRLVCDQAYADYLVSRNPEKAEALRMEIDAQLDRLVGGEEAIILEDGTAEFASEQQGAGVYHNLAGYKPTADMREPEDQNIDTDRLDAEDAEDS